MQIQLTVRTGHHRTSDVAIEYGMETSVGEVAATLADSLSLSAVAHPTVRLEDDHLTLDPGARVASTNIRSGSAVSVVEANRDRFELPGAEGVLEVLSGPATGQTFGLRRGENSIGRGDACAVRIPDHGLSRNHAVIRLGDTAAIADVGSKNGTYVNGEPADGVRAVDESDTIAFGSTECRVRVHGAPSSVSFNRPPRVQSVLRAKEYQVPSPPDLPRKQRVPVVGVFLPLGLAVLTFLIDSGSPMSLVFAAASPLVLLARYVESTRTGDRYYERATAEWSDAMDHLEESRRRSINREIRYRTTMTPSAQDVMTEAALRSSRLWERAVDDADYLVIGAGVATQSAESVIVRPPKSSTNPDLTERASASIGVPSIPDVPIVLPLRGVGNVGLADPQSSASSALPEAAARGLLVQLAGLHSPRDLHVCALLAEERAQAWDWLKWLPHAAPPAPVIGGSSIAVGTDADALVTELTSLVTSRMEASSGVQGAVRLPTVIVVVDERSGVEQARMTLVLEQGPPVGVHTIWIGTSVRQLPAACGAVIGVSANDLSSVTFGAAGVAASRAKPDIVGVEAATRFARDLAPVVDRSASGAGSTVPSIVRLSDLVGPASITEPGALAARWMDPSGPLAAPVGATESGPLVLDIRVDGPHGLVAGTTGSGKSEFLQCLVASLAARHSPSRLAFLFVDYKGGAAFRGCESMPHAVGMVTDLDAHLVQRVLVSLRAELTRREHVLNEAGAKDLVELESMGHPDTPANLLILIDEFAALTAEVPEFVDGVVNIAQRGRSLGLHLVLATQRPAGVVTDYIRANMNMRVALRVASTEESVDVIAAPDAASISRDRPGRAVVRLGPGDLVPFQSGFVGAPMGGAESTPAVRVAPFGLGPVDFPDRPDRSSASDETELQRFVETARAAATALSLPPTHRPWLAPLEPSYVLEHLVGECSPGELPIGVFDRPEAQNQGAVGLDLAAKGHLLCVGTSGAGKTTLLRSMAAAAELADDRWWTYGLDCAGRTLGSIESLPSVGSVVTGDDHERVVRLFRMVRRMTDERLTELGAAGVSELAELRAARPDLATMPRVLLLIDGFHGFMADYERIDGGRWLDELVRLVSDGRPAGIHVVLTTDRRSGIPMRLTGQIQQHLTLRLATADDYALAGLKAEQLGESPPPGRGLLDGVEIQIATIAGATDGPSQTAALAALADASSSADRPPPIERLPDVVPYDGEILADLPPFVGVRDRDLEPVAVPGDSGVVGVFGPRRSGRTNALHVVCRALQANSPDASTVLVGRSTEHEVWDRVLPNEPATHEVFRELAAQLARPGQLILAIDDYSDVTDDDLDAALALLVPSTRNLSCRIVVADEVSLARSAYGSAIVAEIRRSKTGLLLAPDPTTDGDLFGLNLSRARIKPVPGRGVLADRGQFETVQVAYRGPVSSRADIGSRGG